MKAIVFRFFLIFIIITNLSKISFPQDCFWSSQAGGNLGDEANRICTDREGNLYAAGRTGSNPCYFNTDTIYVQGDNHDPFLIKYDASGNEIWILDLSGGVVPNYPDEYCSVNGIVLDSINNFLYATGSFYQYLNLKGIYYYGMGNTIFLIKIDLDGHVIWVRTADGTGDDQAFGVTCDEQGNIYISGTNQADAIFDSITIPRGGFIAKYDPNGNVIWAKHKFRYGPSIWYPFSEVEPINLIYSNNNIIINGNLRNDTIIIDTTIIIEDPGFKVSSFLSSFDLQGDLRWIKTAGAPWNNCGEQFSTDTSNNLYITGVFENFAVFGNDTLFNPSVPNDGFLAKYDHVGTYIWALQTHATGQAWGLGLVADPDGGVYLSGFFYGSIQFGNTTLESSSVADIFLAHFNSEGELIGVRQYVEGYLSGLALDKSGNINLAGSFTNSLTIGPNTFVSRGNTDAFVAKCSAITGIEKSATSSSNQLLIYANPTTGKCNIIIPDEFLHEQHLTLQIYDNTGKLIQQIPVTATEGKISFNIRAEAKGVYNAILSNGKKSFTGKIVFN